MKRFKLLSLAGAMTLALAACGGGGGGTAVVTNGVGGGVNDPLVADAEIWYTCDTDNDGTAEDIQYSSNTDTNGEYEITLPASCLPTVLSFKNGTEVGTGDSVPFDLQSLGDEPATGLTNAYSNASPLSIMVVEMIVAALEDESGGSVNIADALKSSTFADSVKSKKKEMQTKVLQAFAPSLAALMLADPDFDPFSVDMSSKSTNANASAGKKAMSLDSLSVSETLKSLANSGSASSFGNSFQAKLAVVMKAISKDLSDGELDGKVGNTTLVMKDANGDDINIVSLNKDAKSKYAETVQAIGQGTLTRVVVNTDGTVTQRVTDLSNDAAFASAMGIDQADLQEAGKQALITAKAVVAKALDDVVTLSGTLLTLQGLTVVTCADVEDAIVADTLAAYKTAHSSTLQTSLISTCVNKYNIANLSDDNFDDLELEETNLDAAYEEVASGYTEEEIAAALKEAAEQASLDNSFTVGTDGDYSSVATVADMGVSSSLDASLSGSVLSITEEFTLDTSNFTDLANGVSSATVPTLSVEMSVPEDKFGTATVTMQLLDSATGDDKPMEWESGERFVSVTFGLDWKVNDNGSVTFVSNAGSTASVEYAEADDSVIAPTSAPLTNNITDDITTLFSSEVIGDGHMSEAKIKFAKVFSVTDDAGFLSGVSYLSGRYFYKVSFSGLPLRGNEDGAPIINTIQGYFTADEPDDDTKIADSFTIGTSGDYSDVVSVVDMDTTTGIGATLSGSTLTMTDEFVIDADNFTELSKGYSSASVPTMLVDMATPEGKDGSVNVTMELMDSAVGDDLPMTWESGERLVSVNFDLDWQVNADGSVTFVSNDNSTAEVQYAEADDTVIAPSVVTLTNEVRDDITTLMTSEVIGEGHESQARIKFAKAFSAVSEQGFLSDVDQLSGRYFYKVTLDGMPLRGNESGAPLITMIQGYFTAE
ncbi:MAG: hypothetical protein HQL54_01390 [Magnetococcales bacterium]|nr:hypothetical protein [Magnetococcales bacterium]